jgi:hypothetical protein
MSTRTSWLAGLLLGVALCLPITARAQGPNFNGPVFELPLPTMWGQRDTGPYVAGELLFMRLNNPLRAQTLAFRGLWDIDGTLDGGTRPGNPIVEVIDNDNAGAFLNAFFLNQGFAGQFIGSGSPALTAKDGGDAKFEPGFRLTLGYRLPDGIAIEVVHWRMADYAYSGGASNMPMPQVGVGNDFSNSFISAPFFNFSPFWAGAFRDVISNVLPVPDPGTRPVVVYNQTAAAGAVFVTAQELLDLQTLRGLPLPANGIWNAAEDMTITFEQEIWSLELNGRFPICLTDNTRTYAVAGLRYIQLYENFTFRVSDATIEGFIFPENVATYSNNIQNRMYGLQAGMGNEAYLGGGFALSVEGRLGVFANYHPTEVTLERGDDGAVGVKRNDNGFNVSGMFSLGAYLWYYPIEGVQLRAGYEYMGMFGVHRSPNPVSFNVGQITPEYSDMYLGMDGFSMGIAFVF